MDDFDEHHEGEDVRSTTWSNLHSTELVGKAAERAERKWAGLPFSWQLNPLEQAQYGDSAAKYADATGAVPPRIPFQTSTPSPRLKTKVSKSGPTPQDLDGSPRSIEAPDSSWEADLTSSGKVYQDVVFPSRFPCWVRATYSWGGETKRDLSFVEGDLIEALNAGDGLWWMGRLRRDPRAIGMFPSNFVKVLEDGFTPATNSRRSTPPQQASSSPQGRGFREPFQAYENIGSRAATPHRLEDRPLPMQRPHRDTLLADSCRPSSRSEQTHARAASFVSQGHVQPALARRDVIGQSGRVSSLGAASPRSSIPRPIWKTSSPSFRDVFGDGSDTIGPYGHAKSSQQPTGRRFADLLSTFDTQRAQQTVRDLVAARDLLASQPHSVQLMTGMESPGKMSSYCTGALAAQDDFDASFIRIQLPKLPGSENLKYLWQCNACEFNAHDDNGRLLQRIQTSFGVRHRFAFLAKTHMPYSELKSASWPGPVYGCPFCSAKEKPSIVCANSSMLMAHIATEHRQGISAEVERRTRSILGRQAAFHEDWDVNLPDVTGIKNGLPPSRPRSVAHSAIMSPWRRRLSSPPRRIRPLSPTSEIDFGKAEFGVALSSKARSTLDHQHDALSVNPIAKLRVGTTTTPTSSKHEDREKERQRDRGNDGFQSDDVPSSAMPMPKTTDGVSISPSFSLPTDPRYENDVGSSEVPLLDRSLAEQALSESRNSSLLPQREGINTAASRLHRARRDTDALLSSQSERGPPGVQTQNLSEIGAVGTYPGAASAINLAALRTALNQLRQSIQGLQDDSDKDDDGSCSDLSSHDSEDSAWVTAYPLSVSDGTYSPQKIQYTPADSEGNASSGDSSAANTVSRGADRCEQSAQQANHKRQRSDGSNDECPETSVAVSKEQNSPNSKKHTFCIFRDGPGKKCLGTDESIPKVLEKLATAHDTYICSNCWETKNERGNHSRCDKQCISMHCYREGKNLETTNTDDSDLENMDHDHSACRENCGLFSCRNEWKHLHNPQTCPRSVRTNSEDRKAKYWHMYSLIHQDSKRQRPTEIFTEVSKPHTGSAERPGGRKKHGVRRLAEDMERAQVALDQAGKPNSNEESRTQSERSPSQPHESMIRLLREALTLIITLEGSDREPNMYYNLFERVRDEALHALPKYQRNKAPRAQDPAAAGASRSEANAASTDQRRCPLSSCKKKQICLEEYFPFHLLSHTSEELDAFAPELAREGYMVGKVECEHRDGTGPINGYCVCEMRSIEVACPVCKSCHWDRQSLKVHIEESHIQADEDVTSFRQQILALIGIEAIQMLGNEVWRDVAL